MRGPAFLISAVVLGSWLTGAAVAADAPAAAQGAGQKAILVTGASSGIGHAIALRLATDGYFVYAGVRKDSDLKAMSGIHNVQPVLLDVTSPQQIAAAAATVREGGRGLYGLVNNAGIGSFEPVVAPHNDEFDQIMAVNAAGPYRLTQALGPLIIAQKGRIANIGSIGGVIATAGGAAYGMSKFAIEAFTDALADEMKPLGVRVSVVEPGTYRTNINVNARERGQPADGIDPSQNGDPDQVARAVEHALFDADPKQRYLVVPSQPQAEWVIRSAMTRLVQLNEGQPFTYDRAALVKMLDDALAHARPRTP